MEKTRGTGIGKGIEKDHPMVRRMEPGMEPETGMGIESELLTVTMMDGWLECSL